MSKILIVDDDNNIREQIKKYAKFEGFEAEGAENGLLAVELCKTHKFDIVIMDIMMPKLDGFSACKEIRKFSDVPIIILSARGEEFDRIRGFESGADDYVVKPFSQKELMLRIATILRRCGFSLAKDTDIFENEGLTVDFLGRLVSIDGNQIRLSPKEYELLFFLVKNRGIALSREKLLNEVWDYDFLGDYRTVDTHIKQLRKALGPYGKFISTIRGTGYRFD